MRITTSMIYSQLAQSMQNALSELSEQNTRLSTGKKINKISDDIVAATKAVDYKVNISGNEQYKTNIDQANLSLNFTDTTMSAIHDNLTNLKRLTIMGTASDTQADRDAYASQAAAWRDSLLSLSNNTFGDRHVFSGSKTDQHAFVFNAGTNSYDYNGDNSEIRIPIGKGADVAANVQGSRAFSFSLRGPLPTALSDGTPLSYTQTTDPATGINSVTVEIGNAGDPDHDTFTFSNVMDVANILSFSWKYQDVNGADLNADPSVSQTMAKHRVDVLNQALGEADNQVLTTQSEIGTRQVFLSDQSKRLDSNTVDLKNALSKTEDADLTETAVAINQTETALEALRASAARVLSKSLLDFLQ